MAATARVAVCPAVTVWLAGCVVIVGATGAGLTVSVVLALAPEPAVAVIVVVPGPRPVASPVASMVATAPLLLSVHVTAVPPVPVIVTGVAEPAVAPFPNWPTSLPGPSAPQHFTEPSDRSAQVCKPPWPAAMAMAPVSGDPLPPTRTGVLELVVVPSPSCPSRFRPQHHTVPSPRSAQVCRYPPLTVTAPVRGDPLPPTRTGGDALLPLVPLPSCPSLFSPQHCTLWSPRPAQVCSHPAVTAMAPAMPATRTGVGESVMVPSPSSPWPFRPQHHTVPSPRNSAQV